MPTVTVDTTLIERPTTYNTSGYNVAQVLIPNISFDGDTGPVTISVVFSEDNLPSSLDYTIELSASENIPLNWDNKSVSGFDIIIDTEEVVPACSIDAVVTWSRG
jgi:hypothetical protein